MKCFLIPIAGHVRSISGIRTASFVVLAAIVLGCSGDDGTQIPTSSAGGIGSTTAAPSASADSDDIGPPECDAYLRDMAACIAKAPESEREKRTVALEATRTAWRAQSKSPETKANLPAACRAAAEALKTTPCQ